MSTIEHAHQIIDFLATKRGSDNTIKPVRAVEVIQVCGYVPQHYAKAYGQAVSLLDAACLQADMPWLGRLVLFEKKGNDSSSIWSSWRSHMPEITAAPLRRCWSTNDFRAILSALPTGQGANAWWSAREGQAVLLLERALSVARQT
jgi:hypothetical protein